MIVSKKIAIKIKRPFKLANFLIMLTNFLFCNEFSILIADVFISLFYKQYNKKNKVLLNE